jgi:hypothetical protein
MKLLTPGPNWEALATIGQRAELPTRLGAWQEMFAGIYPPQQVASPGAAFGRLAEELGELAEAVRVFTAEPGYFLSEAADVFAWLMHVKSDLDSDRDVPTRSRGPKLEATFWHLYPDSCSDCGQRMCACPPILASTIGRIAHEVPAGRGSFAGEGRFMTADRGPKNVPVCVRRGIVDGYSLSVYCPGRLRISCEPRNPRSGDLNETLARIEEGWWFSRAK